MNGLESPMFGATNGSRDKVWVEAERSRDGRDAILTLADVSLRRKMAQENNGRHNATLQMSRLESLGFPMQLVADLERGRPVRFRMNTSAFSDLVHPASSSELSGLEGRSAEPSARQVEALRQYAAEHGARWKHALRSDWMQSAARIRGELSPELQQLRNNFGPSWLANYTLASSGPRELSGLEGPGHNHAEYTHYVVLVDTRRNPHQIVSGWSYSEDAKDFLRDMLPQVQKNFRVYTKAFLRSKGLDPDDDRVWIERGTYPIEQEETEDIDLQDAAVIQDAPPLGSRTAASFAGKHIGVFSSEDEAIAALQRLAEKDNYYPGLYYIDDHGGINPRRWPR